MLIFLDVPTPSKIQKISPAKTGEVSQKAQVEPQFVGQQAVFSESSEFDDAVFSESSESDDDNDVTRDDFCQVLNNL